MDQRNFITFLLIAFCLYVGSTYLMNKMYPPPPKGAAGAVEEPGKEAAGTPVEEGGPASKPAKIQKAAIKPPSRQAQVPEKREKISTGKMEVEFSNYGAGIVSLKLLPFKEWKFPDPLPEDYWWKKWMTLVYEKPGQAVSVELVPESFSVRTDLRAYAVVDLPGQALNRRPWKLESREDREITYSLDLKDKGLRLVKTFKFEPDSFLSTILLKVENLSDEDNTVEGLTLAWGPNVGQINVEDSANIINAVVLTPEKKQSVASKAVDEEISYPGKPLWSAVKNHYFAAVFVPRDGAWNAGKARHDKYGGLHAGMSADLRLKARGSVDLSATLYAGPQDYGLLKTLGSRMHKVVDFGFFDWLAIPMLYILKWLHSVIPNYGLAIILLTILVRLLMWYPTHKGQTSMKHYQKAMAQLQPRLETLKKIYKDDAQKLNAETMKMYKEYGVNPLGGCLPMLIQLPIFVALYSALNNAFELRGAPFFWVWSDLSHRDPTYLLYLGMGASMFLQQKITPAPQSSPEMAQQQKMMLYLMPVMFTGMSVVWGWPTGLLLYWAASNMLSIAQQIYVNRTVE